MNNKIFVTGATGFVGRHLVQLLIRNGYRVTSLVRARTERKIKKDSRTVIGDLSKIGNWQNTLKGHDLLIHLAAEISSRNPKSFEKNNVVATKNLIKAAKVAKIKKIILFSSAAVTSIRQDPYSSTKKEQEEIVKNSNLNYIIIRPSMIYGPDDTKNIGWLINLVKKLPMIPLPGGGKFGRQPVFVDDICKIVLKIIEGNYNRKIFEIHGRDYISMSKMILVITKNLKQFKIIFPVPLFSLVVFFWIFEKIHPNPKFTSDQIKSLISGEKFSGDKWWETFDIMPTSFESGVRQMINNK